MTAKEYLSQVFYIDQRINCKLDQVMRLRENATKATATLSDMPHSDSPNLKSMENTICKIVDLEREINRDIDQLVDLKAEAREALAQMPNPDESLILELRYFSRKTWEKIAEETGYSVRHVTRLHGRGLQHFRIPDKSVLKCP